MTQRTIILQNAPAGQLGNRMFQHVYLHALQALVPGAVLTGYQLPEFGLQSPAVPLPGRVLSILGGHQLALPYLADLLNRGIYDHLNFRAYVQRLEFFPSRSQFAAHFPLRQDWAHPWLGDDFITVNVRGAEVLGDLHADYAPVPVDFYQRVVAQSGRTPVVMGQLGDDAYSEAIRRAFAGAHFLGRQSVLDDFEFVRHSHHIVCSISTFSWLAAWLSDSAQTIHLPLRGLFNPLQRADVDLLPLWDARYRFYEFPVEKWQATPEQLQALTAAQADFAEISHEQARLRVRYHGPGRLLDYPPAKAKAG